MVASVTSALASIASSFDFKVFVKSLAVCAGKLVKSEPSPTNEFAVIFPLELILSEAVMLPAKVAPPPSWCIFTLP